MPMSPCSPRRRSLERLPLLIALVAAVLWVAVASPAAHATDYTWSGGAGAGAKTWSTATNWLGDVAPGSGATIGTLTFPELSSLVFSENDLSGVSVDQLAINNTHGFGLGGNALSLGSGGLSFSAAEHPPLFSTVIATPLQLTSNQTWTVSAPAEAFSPDGISLTGALSGESADLTINLNTFTDLAFGGFPIEKVNVDDEIGNVTINGVETVVPTGEGESTFRSSVELPSSFNATDGHSLTLHDVEASSPLDGSATGAITAIKSSVSLAGSAIGAITANESGLNINGTVVSLSLDKQSLLAFQIEPTGDTAGTDYEQLTSGGTINLGGGMLTLNTVEPSDGSCPSPPVGQVYTLISTTGSLTGTFGNAPEGSTVGAECLIGTADGAFVERVYLYRINYSTSGATKTVTATALPAVPMALAEAPQPPTIGGTAIEGQVLSESHGGWNNKPTSYAYQWQRCNPAGSDCQAIAGATAQSYTLTTADVGSTVRVQETASNSEGASTPDASAATAVVQAAPSTGGGGSTSSGSESGSNSSDSTTATISSAQIAALLGQQLIPSGNAAKIGALLKGDGLTMSFKMLEAGTLVVGWYEVPAGAKLAKHSKAKPVLVASGQMTFSAAGIGKLKIKLTAAGRKLLKEAKRAKLEARGVFTATGEASASSTRTVLLRR
jgi:hypothetical protein